MLLSARRFHRRLGPSVVGMALASAPSVAAYRFDYTTGWGTRYADPASAASISGDTRAVAFGTGNTRFMVGGITGSSSGVRVWNWSQKTGYGTRNLQAFTDPNSVTLARDGQHILVSGPNACAEYNYTSAGFGSLVFTQTAGPNIAQSIYIYDDRYFVMGLTSTDSFRIFSRASTPALLGSRAHFGTVTQFSMSPVVHSGTRVLAMSHTGGTVRLYPIASDGSIGTEITSTMGSGVNRVAFDRAGRLIVGRSSNQIDVYTLNSAGAQTLVQSITNSTSITFTGTAVNSLEYDEDTDVLFVGSTGAPFMTAYRMGGAGFSSKYADPSTSVGAAVRNIALHYGEAWKYAQN
jgi:WD40 repeat protein